MQLVKISKKEFLNLFYDLHTTAKTTFYNLFKSRIDDIAKLLPGISNWVYWWNARKYHIFPAFRIHGLSKVNLAKRGNSTHRN